MGWTVRRLAVGHLASGATLVGRLALLLASVTGRRFCQKGWQLRCVSLFFKRCDPGGICAPFLFIRWIFKFHPPKKKTWVTRFEFGTITSCTDDVALFWLILPKTCWETLRTIACRTGFTIAWTFFTNFNHSHWWNEFLALNPNRSCWADIPRTPFKPSRMWTRWSSAY